jgi:hypothetical protein
MRPASKIRPPILAKELDAIEIKRLDGFELDQCPSKGCALANETGERFRFDGVRIVAGVLRETKLEILSFVDVLCERCDFSMIDWPKAKLTRVELRGSRVAGAKVLRGEFDNVRFVDCHLEYASFPEARFRSVSFEQCRLKEAERHPSGATRARSASRSRLLVRSRPVTAAKHPRKNPPLGSEEPQESANHGQIRVSSGSRRSGHAPDHASSFRIRKYGGRQLCDAPHLRADRASRVDRCNRAAAGGVGDRQGVGRPCHP